MLAEQTPYVKRVHKNFVGSANPLKSRARYPIGMAQSGKAALGKWVQALRKQQDVPQIVAAEGIGISRSHLSNIETGRHWPGRDTLLAIAAYYKASVDQFISPPREPPEKNEATTSEQLLELAILFLGQERDPDPARYARRLSLIQRALQEAQHDGKKITAETVPAILADALERPHDDPVGE
jgi:transcriptional regulator with XRE-family HTH domain